MDYSSFKCLHKDCPGVAVAIAKDGRLYVHPVHKWCYINMPATMKIHRCTVCSEDWLTKETSDIVTAYLATSFEEHREMMMGMVERHRKAMAKEAK